MFLSVQHLYVRWVICFKWPSPRTHDTRTCWRVVGSGAVTTRFNGLGLSRPGIAHRSPACEANTLPQSHCGRAPTSLSKQETHEPCWSPEYQRLYTEFLSEGLIFAYQQSSHKINKKIKILAEESSIVIP